MSLRFTFNAMAERELNEAAAYYESERAGIGAAFMGEIERTIERLLEQPESAPLLNQSVRCVPIHRFPYLLLYSVKLDQLRILAIGHQIRRPFYWRGRY